MTLKDEDIQALTRALNARALFLRAEVSDKLGQAANDAQGGTGSSDTSESSFALAESGLDFAEAGRDLNELGAIDAALAAISDGSYGVCSNCGVDIEDARLRVQPLALRCTACQTRDESRRGEHHARL